MIFLDIETLQAPDTSIMRDKSALSKSALSPHYGRICCIGFISNTRRVAIIGANERAILNVYSTFFIEKQPVCTWNGRNFDIPFIDTRVLIHGLGHCWNPIKDHEDMRDVFLRSESTNSVCGRVGLNEIAQLCGIPGKINSGENVQALWEKHDYQAIAEYCLDDCRIVAQLWAHVQGIAYTAHLAPIDILECD